MPRKKSESEGADLLDQLPDTPPEALAKKEKAPAKEPVTTPAEPSVEPSVEPKAPSGLRDKPDNGLSSKALNMKRVLAAQPRERILIPKTKGEPVGATEFFGINGYKFYIRKGEVVEVPRQVAEMYWASIGADAKALGDHPLNLAGARDDASRRALNL